MLLFPNAKINVGLDVLRRREDGFHDVETLMVPVEGVCDILELTPADEAAFVQTGAPLDCSADDNLCMRAWRLIGAPPVKIHLHKIIPSGAGLGGGSSDAAFTLKGLDKLFSMGLSDERLEELAAELGSDVPFFIKNTPQIARGRGEILSSAENIFQGKYIIIIKPDIHISTREAYEGVRPRIPEVAMRENAFEPALFDKYPVLKEVKASLIAHGAVYASMSGSGSAIYGIFDAPPAPYCFSEKKYTTLQAILT